MTLLLGLLAILAVIPLPAYPFAAVRAVRLRRPVDAQGLRIGRLPATRRMLG